MNLHLHEHNEIFQRQDATCNLCSASNKGKYLRHMLSDTQNDLTKARIKELLMLKRQAALVKILVALYTLAIFLLCLIFSLLAVSIKKLSSCRGVNKTLNRS